MDQIHINTGSAVGAGNGDVFRNALIKTEDNFNYLYGLEWDSWMPYTGSALITGSLGITGSDNGDVDLISDFKIENNGDDSIHMSCSAVTSSENSFVIRRDINPQSNRFISITDTIIQLRHRLQCRFSTQITPAFMFNASGISNNGIDRDLVIKTIDSDNRFFSDASTDRIGIGTEFPQTDFHVGPTSRVSSSIFNIAELPSTDPEIEGRMFQNSSDEVFGTPGSEVLCVSRGSNPLITDGLKYMLSPGIIAHNNTEYFSPKNTSSGIGSTPNSIYSSSVRYGALQPTASIRRNSSPYSPANRLASEVNNNNNLYYLDFNQSGVYHCIISSSIFKGGTNDPSTIIIWMREPTPPSSGFGTPDIRYFGNGSTFQAVTTRRSAPSDLKIYMGDSVTPTMEILNIWDPSFVVDTTTWHMHALTVEGGNGAGHNFTYWISGSGGGYNSTSVTTTGFDIQEYDWFAINNTTTDNNTDVESVSPTADYTSFLYYSKSLSELELNQVYNFFSASHGL